MTDMLATLIRQPVSVGVIAVSFALCFWPIYSSIDSQHFFDSVTELGEQNAQKADDILLFDTSTLIRAFDQTRRPRPQIKPQPLPKPVDPLRGYRLLGIVKTDSIAVAVLDVDGRRIRVRQGDRVGTVEVIKIGSRDILFMAGQEARSLSM